MKGKSASYKHMLGFKRAMWFPEIYAYNQHLVITQWASFGPKPNVKKLEKTIAQNVDLYVLINAIVLVFAFM